MNRKVLFYVARSGHRPFLAWLEALDEPAQWSIEAYIDRVANGGAQNNVKNLKGGLWEIKMNKGPGYRIYFGHVEHKAILLLTGGDKQSQSRDIRLARSYWSEYESNK